MTESQPGFVILGTGALGGFYGSRLLQGGARVRFIARSDVEQIRAHGLRVDSPLGDWRGPVEVYRDSDAIAPEDVVVIALKTTMNRHLPELLAPLVRPGTVLLNLQNGLTMEDELAAAFPEARVVAGMCFICSHKAGPGHIAHLDYGAVTLAPYDDAAARCLPALRTAFVAGGLEVTVADSLPAARWRKLAWNIPFNGLSVLLDTDTDRLVADPDARRLAERLMAEVAAGAAACGHPFAGGFRAAMFANTERMLPYAPSMRLDYLAGRALEIEYLYRRPLREMKRHGCTAPAIASVADQLAYLERYNCR